MANSELFGDDTLTLITAGGPIVKVKVIAGPTFSGSDTGHQANWSILVQEHNLSALINGLFPQPVLVSFGGGLVSIKPPNQQLPNSLVFYANGYSANPFKREIGDPFHSDPKVLLDPAAWLKTYSTIYKVDITFATKSDGRSSETPGADEEDPADISTIIDDLSIEIGGQFLRVGDHSLKWDVNGGELNEELSIGITQTVPHITHSVTRHRVENPDFTSIASYLGKINSTATTKANLGFVSNAECTMFVGASGQRTGNWGGGATWDMTYKFIQRDFTQVNQATNQLQTVTWNHFYRPKSAEWQRLKIVGSTERDVYEKGNLRLVYNSLPA